MIASPAEKTESGPHELAGRVALVTGASRNIGRAIALSLAQGGASVIVSARQDRDGVEEVVSTIRQGGGTAIATFGDVSRREDVEAVIAAGQSAFGRLDILVNNAAVRKEVLFENLTFENWREVLSVALDGPFLCMKAAFDALVRSDQAAIVNIGGLTAYTGAAHRAHVVAAKAGLDGLTKATAHDLREPRLPRPDRDRASGRPAAAPPRNPVEPRGPEGDARGSRGDGAIPVRPRGPLHHWPDHSRQWRRLPSLTVSL
jgi:NADP-dependent 3-hydroxy acid dehydrogenase YdfG